MRKILKIAKLELSILFYSPVAWLVLAIFMVQCAMGFLDNMQSTRTGLTLGYGGRPITATLFGGNSGLFTSIQGNLYLYLPILTMGLMSRETSSGSIKLLLSSPVRLREIILGKYLAIIGYGLMLIAVLGIFALIGIFSIPNADAGMVCAGLFGLYLLVCTYAAIGLFMSCLTTYQVVAAISTLAVFAVLRFVGTLGQEIDFVRDLTYFLSISGRSTKMVAGMITTKDVLYYLIIIALFLSLCVLRLKNERELRPMSIKAGRYVLLVCCALLLGYLSARPMFTGYLDATTAKSLTITKGSQQIAKQIKGELKVTTYANMLAPQVWSLLPAARNNDLGLLEQYQRFIPDLNVSYTYFYEKPVDSDYADYRHNPNLRGITNTDQIAEKMATNMDINGKLFMPPASINKLINLKPEGYMSVRKLEYNGKSTFLRFYVGPGEQNPNPSEAEFMAALKRLLIKVPKIAFLTGNNERGTVNRGDREYQLISAMKVRRNALVNQGFDVDTIDLNHQEIAADIDILVLGDPTILFTPQAQQKLSAYINKGGNMLITGDPGRQEILNPILQQLGVQLKAGLLVKPDKNLTPGFISAGFPAQPVDLDSNINRLQTGGGTVAMQGAVAVENIANAGFTVKPILLSPPDGWNKMGEVDLTSSAMTFDPAKGDQKGAFPVTMAMTRKVNNKEQRIIVSGDADFISNAELTRPKRGYNEYYMFGLFRWFSNGNFPVDVTRPEPKDLTMSVSREQITVMNYICKGLIPAVIAILGAIVLFKRRRN